MSLKAKARMAAAEAERIATILHSEKVARDLKAGDEQSKDEDGPQA